MAPSTLTRRAFLHTTAMAAAGSCLRPAAVRAAPMLPTRPNVSVFNEASPNILTYAGAVKEMRARSATDVFDPLGWTFWANIHGMPADDPNDHRAWRQCD